MKSPVRKTSSSGSKRIFCSWLVKRRYVRIERHDRHIQRLRQARHFRPIVPRPIKPSVLPRSSLPVNFFFSHLPAFIDASACATGCAIASKKVMVCSATLMAFRRAYSSPAPLARCGIEINIVHATPARPITTRRLAFSSSSASLSLRLRTSKASASRISSATWPFVFGRLTTSHDGSAFQNSDDVVRNAVCDKYFHYAF